MIYSLPTKQKPTPNPYAPLPDTRYWYKPVPLKK